MKSSQPPTVAETLRQKQPFRTVSQEAYLGLLLCTARLSHEMDVLLKGYGATQVQYNVLRILRGAGGEGLGRNQIRDRLVDTMPDVTRLLDRMEKLGWIVRVRATEDRRQVPTHLTGRGRKLLVRLEEPVAALHARHAQGIPASELRALLRTLGKLRQNATGDESL